METRRAVLPGRVDDPNQNHDLSHSPEQHAHLDTCRKLLDAALGQKELRKILGGSSEISEEEREKLASLGYVSGPVSDFSKLQQADMREVLEDNHRLGDAQEACFAARKCTPLMNLYPELLRRYPRATPVWRNYGIQLMKSGSLQKAADAFQRALELNPKDAANLVNLGGIDLKNELALGHQVALKNLGILYSQYLHDPQHAVPHFKRYLELMPSSPDAPAIKKYIQQNQ